MWQQTFERYEGKSFGGAGSKDYFFFFHSFLWAFAPWSVIAYIAVVHRLKNFSSKKQEWLTTGTFLTMAVLITFSGFKLPHYINIIFPIASVLTAAYLWERINEKNVIRSLFVTQLVICILCLLVAAIINAWAFPLRSWVVITAMALLIVICAIVLKRIRLKDQKLIALSVLTSILIFYLLNSNFYPQLLTYQAGNELAFESKNKVDPKNVFIWPGIYNPSFQFYTHELKKVFSDSVLSRNQSVWILTDRNSLPQLKENNLMVLEKYSYHDYNIGTMSLKFINPNTRKETLDSLFLIRVK